MYDLLDLDDYQFRPERMMVLNIEAYDWNCPQHITARYTTEDIEEAFEGQRNLIEKLKTEIKQLKQKLKEKEV